MKFNTSFCFNTDIRRYNGSRYPEYCFNCGYHILGDKYEKRSHNLVCSNDRTLSLEEWVVQKNKILKRVLCDPIFKHPVFVSVKRKYRKAKLNIAKQFVDDGNFCTH